MARALHERQLTDQLQLVAINELAPARTIAHLTRFDSTHGPFPGEVGQVGDQLQLGKTTPIKLLHEPQPEQLPWGALDIDLVVESTGTFADRASAQRHLDSGAKRLMFSNPATAEVDATVVYGYNHDTLTAGDSIISAASCSTNCLIPVLATLHRRFGIRSGTTWTVHSAMHDQPVIDAYHNTDLRKTRAAANAIIPVDTGLNKGIDRLLPELAGRFQSLAMRVPTMNVSAINCALVLAANTSAEEVNDTLAQAAKHKFNGVLGYTNEPVASCDFNHDSRSAVVDGSQTRVAQGTLLALHIWFDNEWAYANRMVDVAAHWASIW